MMRLKTAGESTALSRELSDFLIELSIGLHKNAIYPPGHPLLENATSDLSRKLSGLLQERQTLSLGVARHQLVIEGVATDDANPVLRELASRLHKHHLGAVKFTLGVDEDQLTSMLGTVAVDAGRLHRPLGMEGTEVLAQWSHIRLYPMTFAQLQLIEDDPDVSEDDGDSIRATPGGKAASLWLGLARAALVNDATVNIDPDDADSVDPKVVAHAIEETKRDAAYDQVVVGYLLQIAEDVKTRGGRDAAALRKRISSLVGTLSHDTLKRLLEMSGDVSQRRKFVADASQGMAVDAVVHLVKAASETSGQTISHSMMRMLSKLASHAEQENELTRHSAEEVLRDQVGRLLEGWELEDPNPDSYRLALEKMATSAPMFANADHEIPIEPERLIAMGIEIETLGGQVWRSVDIMASRDDLTALLNLIDSAPSDWIRDLLWRHVATPERLAQQLMLDPLRTSILVRMITRMGAAAVDPVLDAIDSAGDEKTARLVEMLEYVGAGGGELIVDRLSGLRGGALRPLMALLGRYPEWKSGYNPTPWLTHPDSSIRREALRQLFRQPESREFAIVRALADADEQNVRLGVGAAMNGCPRDAAHILRARADEETLSQDLRALGIRAVASYRSPDTPVWLASRAVKEGRLLKRAVLANKTPEMLAALEGLAVHWRDDPAASEPIALALESGDDEIRQIVRERGDRR